MDRNTERHAEGMRYWPPGTGAHARDEDGGVIASPRTGAPVIVTRESEQWACPDCRQPLPASPAAARLHLDHQCKERNQ